MKPDASRYNASPAYIAGLIEKIQQRHDMTQRAIARQIGVSFTSLRDWQKGRSKWRYPDQLILELLAESDSINGDEEMENAKLTLRSLIEAVEDNNRINDARWSDWGDAGDIVDTYNPDGILAGDGWANFADEDVSAKEAAEILSRAIASNGRSLAAELEQLAVRVWGEGIGCWYSDKAASYAD